MTMTDKSPDLVAIHELSFGNEARLSSSTQAGCFDQCLSIFPVSHIKHWIDDKPQRTALCPNCGFDTVLADDGSFELTHELLRAMNARYMGGDDSEKVNSPGSFLELLRDYEKRKLQ